MINRPGVRVVLAVAFAITAVGALAAPAAAETVLVACNGNCGYYEVYDNEPPPAYGANCKYEPGYDLDWMSARPPLMHGDRPTNDQVRWRIKVLRASPTGLSFNTIYTSAWDSAQANDMVPARAGRGFGRITWYASENPSGKYKIRIELQWRHNGNLEGYARIEYNSYKQLWNGNTYASDDYCADSIV